MKINSISSKPIFKAQLSPEIKKGMLSKVENIVFEHGENSKQYKYYANNIRRCLDYSPEVKVDISYNPVKPSYHYVLEKSGEKTFEGEATEKEELFSADNVNSLAYEILIIALYKKIPKYC